MRDDTGWQTEWLRAQQEFLDSLSETFSRGDKGSGEQVALALPGLDNASNAMFEPWSGMIRAWNKQLCAFNPALAEFLPQGDLPSHDRIAASTAGDSNVDDAALRSYLEACETLLILGGECSQRAAQQVQDSSLADVASSPREYWNHWAAIHDEEFRRMASRGNYAAAVGQAVNSFLMLYRASRPDDGESSGGG